MTTLPRTRDRSREFDIVLWGATGFTGRLVADYLVRNHLGGDTGLRLALAGRNKEKLEGIAKEVGAPQLPILIGDSFDAESLNAIASKAEVLITTVGPYAKYGAELVGACVRNGTDYCDLTGETHFIAAMIDAHEEEAKRTGARIVHCCGYDSIPSDLGTLIVQEAFKQRHGTYASQVKMAAVQMKGAFSGGTIASMLNMMEEAQKDKSILRTMSAPYALNPAGQQDGPDAAEAVMASYDEDFDQWIAPFIMGAVNTKVVRRSNALFDYAYGRDFRYDEAVLCGGGPGGFAKATATGLGGAMAMGAMAIGPIRRFAAGRLPKPGEGPSLERREAGYFDVALLGHHPTDPSKNLSGRIRGDRDPGYGSTSKMLGETAVCLALDELRPAGGCLTPASAMGGALLARLPAAGVTFELDD